MCGIQMECTRHLELRESVLTLRVSQSPSRPPAVADEELEEVELQRVVVAPEALQIHEVPGEVLRLQEPAGAGGDTPVGSRVLALRPRQNHSYLADVSIRTRPPASRPLTARS